MEQMNPVADAAEDVMGPCLAFSNFCRLSISGESLWFNHASRKHATVWTCHPQWGKLGGPYTRMPTHSFYGDGFDIPADVLQHIRDVSWQCAVGFQMQRGLFLCVAKDAQA